MPIIGIFDYHLFIKSIEVTQMAGNLGLKKLFREALPAFRKETISSIESVVQASNRISILMHEKLGFKRVKENPKAIRYRVERIDLITKVEKMVRSQGND